jgi:hypothetical protein
MSVLLAAAALAATASVIATGCVAYILISFWRSGHLMASRTGSQSLALVMVEPANAHRQLQQMPAALPVRRQLRPAYAR